MPEDKPQDARPEVSNEAVEGQRPEHPERIDRSLLEGEAGAQERTWKQQLKRPAVIAALLLGLGVAGLVVWLESGSVNVNLDPEVERELTTNLGLTEGVPVAIKVNQATVFLINEPGGSARTNEVMDNIRAAIEALREEGGRAITLDLETSDLPAIVQTKVDGSERQLIIQLTEEDLVLSGVDDAKFLARIWAERLTDSLKVFLFGEEPQFTEGSPFGEALRAMYTEAVFEEGALSNGALEDAFEGLEEEQRLALATFPEDMQPENPVLESDPPVIR